MNPRERVIDEARKRQRVTLALLDTLTPHPRDELQRALAELAEEGILRLVCSRAREYEWTGTARFGADERALLTMLGTQPRTFGDLERGTAWSTRHIRVILDHLELGGLVHLDGALWTPTESGYARYRGEPPRQGSGGRKEPQELTVRIDASEALAQARAEVQAAVREERAFKVLLALLATVDRRAGVEELARRSYALVDALEAAR